MQKTNSADRTVLNTGGDAEVLASDVHEDPQDKFDEEVARRPGCTKLGACDQEHMDMAVFVVVPRPTDKKGHSWIRGTEMKEEEAQ